MGGEEWGENGEALLGDGEALLIAASPVRQASSPLLPQRRHLSSWSHHRSVMSLNWGCSGLHDLAERYPVQGGVGSGGEERLVAGGGPTL